MSSIDGDVAGRRRREIDPVQLAGDLCEVAVAVDETGDQRETAEIDDARADARRGQHPIEIADRKNAAAPHGDGFGERMPLVHRHHVRV